MKNIFQIPILILILWTSAVSYATHSDVHGCPKIENIDNRTVIDAGLTSHLLDNIDDDTRTKIQLAALLASGPEIGISLIEAVTDLRLLRNNPKYASNRPVLDAANEVRLALAQRDLDGFDAAWDFVRTNPRGADAWEMLVNFPTLRRDHNDLNIIKDYLSRTNRNVANLADELYDDLLKNRLWLDNQSSNIYKFTTKQVENFTSYSTKQGNQAKVMLGKYDNGGPTGYISRAGNNHTYFDMDIKWDEALNLVNGGSNDWKDEMWEMNKKFLQNQKNQNKEFWFSHDPFSPGNEQFFAREVNWLIVNGVQEFEKIGDLWKAIW